MKKIALRVTPDARGFFFEKHDQRPYSSIIDCLNSMDGLREHEVSNVIDLNRVKFGIARISLRGPGNFIVADRHYDVVEESGIDYVIDDRSSGVFLMYRSRVEEFLKCDAGVLFEDGVFYTHPDYDKMTCKLKIMNRE